MADTDLLFPADDSTSEKPAKGPVLPANLEAEAAFLGAVLIDNKVIEELTTPLMAEHFHEPVHQRIYERVLKLLDRNSVATPVTLKPYFESDEALKQLGGTTYLAQLTADGQGLLHPRELAEQIYDLALLRELVTVGRALVGGALDTSETVEPLKQIEKAEAALYEIAEGTNIGSDASTFKDASIAALKLAREGAQVLLVDRDERFVFLLSDANLERYGMSMCLETELIAETAGTVIEMPFAKGDRVAAGDILARLNSGRAEAALTQAQEQRANAQRESSHHASVLIEHGACGARQRAGLLVLELLLEPGLELLEPTGVGLVEALVLERDVVLRQITRALGRATG